MKNAFTWKRKKSDPVSDQNYSPGFSRGLLFYYVSSNVTFTHREINPISLTGTVSASYSRS